MLSLDLIGNDLLYWCLQTFWFTLRSWCSFIRCRWVPYTVCVPAEKSISNANACKMQFRIHLQYASHCLPAQILTSGDFRTATRVTRLAQNSQCNAPVCIFWRRHTHITHVQQFVHTYKALPLYYTHVSYWTSCISTVRQCYSTFFAKCHLLWHSKGLKCQLNIFDVFNRVVIFYINL